jgi:hypothetical protein
VKTGLRLVKSQDCPAVGTGQPPNPCQRAFIDYYQWSQTYDRMSWDPLTTLFAVRGLQGYYTKISGRNQINATDGGNKWQSSSGSQSFLVLNETSGVTPIGDDIDDLICAVPKHAERHA